MALFNFPKIKILSLVVCFNSDIVKLLLKCNSTRHLKAELVLGIDFDCLSAIGRVFPSEQPTFLSPLPTFKPFGLRSKIF